MQSLPAADAKPQEFEFEQMNLQVGGRLQFITHRSIKPVQHFSSLIGYVKDEYIIVRTPVDGGVPIAVTEGEKLTIRVFSGVNVCSFACTVQRVFARPLLYVHLSFPTAIQGTSLRAAMRVKVDMPVSVTGSGAAPVACTLLNLSVTGALVVSPRRLSNDGELVTLQFALTAPPSNQDVQVVTRAIIKNVNVTATTAAQIGTYTYGMQFVELDPVHYTLLQNMTYEALLADRNRIV